MQKVKVPNASELIQLLHALGFVVREIEQPSYDNLKQTHGEDFSIEMTSKNPSLRVVMNPPDVHGTGGKESEIDHEPVPDPLNLLNASLLPVLPEKKRVEARAVMELLIEFITEGDKGSPTAPRSILDGERRRNCMSMESINSEILQRIKFMSTNDDAEEKSLAIEKTQTKPVIEKGTDDGDKKPDITVAQEVVNTHPTLAESEDHRENAEAVMEVDEDIPASPVSNASSIFCSNLSPIGIPLTRQKTWVKGAPREKLIDTSSPLRKPSTQKIGILKNCGPNKVQRHKYRRPEFTPNRLKSAKAEDVHSIAQTRSPREVALMYSKKIVPPRSQSKSKNVTTSSASSASSKSSSTSSLQMNQTKSSIVSTKSEPQNSRKTEMLETRLESLRRVPVYSTRSHSNSNRGTSSSAENEPPKQNQKTIPTPTNVQRIPGSIAGPSKGTASTATKTRSSLLSRLSITSGAAEQSKLLKPMSTKVFGNSETRLVTSERRVDSKRSLCSSNQGISSNGESEASNQKQNRIPTNMQSIPALVARPNKGTAPTDTKTHASLLPRFSIKPSALEPSNLSKPMNTKVPESLETLLETSERQVVDSIRSFSSSKQGTSSNGESEASNQMQNSTPTNTQRIPALVARPNKGKVSTATRVLLPRITTRHRAAEQSKAPEG